MKFIQFVYLFTILLATAKSDYHHNISGYCYFNFGQNCRCKDKSLFPLRVNEVIGTLIIVIFSALSNAAGIGGGEINILIIQFFFLFDTYSSIPLAQCIIFGGSFMTVLLKVWKRHPTKNRSIIDYDLIYFAISPLLSGTTVGVILHMIFPNWLTSILLIALLAITSYATTKKGIFLFKKEADLDVNLSENLINNRFSDVILIEYHEDSIKYQQAKNYIEEEQKLFPWAPIKIIFFIYIVTILMSFLKGGKGIGSIIGLQECSAYYWWTFLSFLAFMILVSFYCGNKLVDKLKILEEFHYEFDEYDVKWNYKLAAKVGIVVFLTGILSGTLGVGGGIIVNPYLIHVGLRSEVVAATSSFMILFSSSISVLLFSIGGLVKFSYGVWFFIFAIIGSILGIYITYKIVEVFKRPSILVLLISLLALLSFLCITTNSIIEAIEKIKDGVMDYRFQNFC